MNVDTRKIVFIVFLSLFFISCAEVKGKKIIYEQPIAEIKNDYILGPSDEVEIIYLFGTQPSKKNYILAIGDVIDVQFYYHVEMNKSVTIRPDGKITLPLKGEVYASGLTPYQLKKKITKLYSHKFKNPEVSITLIKFDQLISQFKQSVVSSNRGQSKVVIIRPDGHISFPFINDIKAAGLTLPQLREIVTSEYRKIVERLFLSLSIKQAKSNLVYVMGEVNKPDYYLMESPTTLTQIIARAGGFLDTAEADSVLILSRNRQKEPVARLVDLEKMLDNGNIGNDLILNQYDVVYVPKTGIAKADLFVSQYINKLIPQIFRVSYGAVYDLNDD